MLKKLITPLQVILLQKKMCPGCTQNLKKAKVIDQCSRVFVHDRKLDTFRRALNEEI